jgi:hypothetical protein
MPVVPGIFLFTSNAAVRHPRGYFRSQGVPFLNVTVITACESAVTVSGVSVIDFSVQVESQRNATKPRTAIGSVVKNNGKNFCCIDIFYTDYARR